MPVRIVIAGRPVRFAGEFADDAFGEARLRNSLDAGRIFRDRTWRWSLKLPAIASHVRSTRAAIVLIGDFGGGTSDFSVMRFDPRGRRRVIPLGHAGIGIAGDTFDYRIIDRAISPLLGKGGHLQGDGQGPARTARVFFRLRPVAPPLADAHAAHAARYRRSGRAPVCIPSGCAI